LGLNNGSGLNVGGVVHNGGEPVLLAMPEILL